MASERSNDELRRRELAAFLKMKREEMPPPRGPGSSQRRLTPGLRREEVAERAGIGTSWYTRLEQARDIRPSEQTLRRVARALKLSKLETRYLLDLALERAARPEGDVPVAPEVALLMNAISAPALVLGRTGNVLAYNTQANALYDFEYVPERNYLKTLFSVNGKVLVANWSEFARHMVAVFRTRSAGMLGDAAVARIVGDLTEQSDEFATWWAERELTEVHAIGYFCNHPFVGRLAFRHACLSVVEHPELTLVGLATELAETKRRLHDLVRQLEDGEHDATHNLWTSLAENCADSVGRAYHSEC
jgi:transcriptional regulator with XRE-family HTH domain